MQFETQNETKTQMNKEKSHSTPKPRHLQKPLRKPTHLSKIKIN